jgi:hypothetical protein
VGWIGLDEFNKLLSVPVEGEHNAEHFQVCEYQVRGGDYSSSRKERIRVDKAKRLHTV